MRKKVLIVNDSKFEGIVLKDLFHQIHCEAIVTDEFNGMGKIEKFQPDIVIVNFIMKNIPGDVYIREIKKRKPNIKCFLSSCNNLKLEDFKDKKIDGILQTPITVEELREKIFNDLNS